MDAPKYFCEPDMIKPECCANCRFATVEYPSEGQPGGEVATCRRYPPQVMAAEQRSVAGQPLVGPKGPVPVVIISVLATSGQFPQLDANAGWCGEWQTKRETLQ